MQATQPQRVIIALSLQYNLIEFTSQKQCYCSANSCLLLTPFNHFSFKEHPDIHQKHAISPLGSALLFDYPLSFFISTLHSTKQKQCFYLLFALFSLTKAIQESSKINKKHLFIRQFLSFKSNIHQLTNLNKCIPTRTFYERILSTKNNKEIIFFCIFVLSLCPKWKRTRHRNK